MTRKIRTLVVDDDVLAARMVEARLLHRFPRMVIESTTQPTDLGNYDIYLIDNDFNGTELGLSLARTIRADHPDALVVAFSGTLTGDLLKRLLNAGCNGACDKSSIEDLDTMLELIAPFVERGETRDGGVIGVLRSMTGLLREWNQRLDRLETK